MEMHEIEELIKTVNRNAIKAMLRNAAILGDAKATDEMKRQAIENVKAIAANKPIPKKSKAKQAKPAAPVAPATQLAQQPAAPAVAAQPTATPPSAHQYPEGLHLSPLNEGGHDETAMKGIFDALPDHEKKHIVDWHAKTKMAKSVDTLYNLFTQLKKHL